MTDRVEQTYALSLGSGDFSAKTLTRQATSDYGCSPGLLRLLTIYAQVLEENLVQALDIVWVEAGIGGLSAETYIDREFVKLRAETRRRTEEQTHD